MAPCAFRSLGDAERYVVGQRDERTVIRVDRVQRDDQVAIQRLDVPPSDPIAESPKSDGDLHRRDMHNSGDGGIRAGDGDVALLGAGRGLREWWAGPHPQCV
jgi:hypothetical protein